MRPLEPLKASDFTDYTNYLNKPYVIGSVQPFLNIIQSYYKKYKNKIFTAQGIKYLVAYQNFYKLLADMAVCSLQAKLIQQKTDVDTALKSFMQGNGIGTDYGYSRSSLIDAYGEYCNYCDMRIPDSALAIEHLCPKSIFPDEALNWKNFYLACPNCNSNKGNRPDANTLAADAKVKLKNLKSPEYDAMKYVVQNNFMWPQNNDAHKSFTYAFEDKNGNTTTLLAFLTKNPKPDEFDYSKGEVKIISTKVEIYLRLLGVRSKSQEANNTIDLLKLNKHKPTDDESLKLSDRRTFNRTKTAIAMGVTIGDFIELTNKTTDVDIINLYLEQVCDTAMFSGFFSLCFELFDISNLVIKYKKDFKNTLLLRYKNTNEQAL